jgi:pantoate--beta-alanine ligase
MRVVSTFSEARTEGRGRVGLVPTMGALHAGHRSLMRAARSRCDTSMVSIFVNPLQFNDVADLDRYPRTVEADLAVCEEEEVDVVFAPTVDDVYAGPGLTRVVVSKVVDRMEGPSRPGHFDGVATVVAKLFAGLRPDVAFFGRKDAQQLSVISAMAADMSFGVEIVPCPTVRAADGLALSSRNVFLSSEERTRALALWRGLMAAADAVVAGERLGSSIENIARSAMDDVDTEYVELADQVTAQRLEVLDRPAFLAVAARVGRTRLIDNVAFDQSGAGFITDRGIREAR